MKFFSGLFIGLTLGFGFLFFGIVAEIYYLLWWKKRISSTDVEKDDYGRHVKRSSFSAINEAQERSGEENGRHGLDLEIGSSKELLLKTPQKEEEEEDDDENDDLELMGLYNLAGQPRFLFTITEETKEDLESEDGKSNKSRKGSRTRSLSDILMALETPFFTPMASPPLKASMDSYKHHGFNPLFESSIEIELNRLRSSPPPKLKFLRDAEEKLYRKLMEEARVISGSVQSSDMKSMAAEEREGRSERKLLNQRFLYSSASSQILPLVSSPLESETIEKKVNGFC